MSADQPRDWDRELAEIDKLIGAGPAKPAPVAGRGSEARSPAPRAQSPASPRATRRDALAVWVRAGLAAILGGAMTQWPYAHVCGGPLFLYVGAVGVVVLAGVWASVGAWRRRMAGAHTVGLLVALWGGVLAAGILLPRIGYARTAAVWWCP